MVRNTQVVHASLAQHITPLTLAHHSLGGYAGTQALAGLNRAVTAQATMIAYLDDFQLMLILTLLALPLLFLVRNTQAARSEVKHAAAIE
jgi:MFS transporter, DHA2 family, multidrug resistance protein